MTFREKVTKEHPDSVHDTYDQYKDMIGETISATLEIRRYDDGTVKYDITDLGGES